MTVQVTHPAPGRILVRGVLTFDTAREARDAGLQIIASAEAREIQVDCGGVIESDSAGLVVLLDWLAAAQRRKLLLRFVGVPDRLFAVAQISEIENLIAPQRSTSL